MVVNNKKRKGDFIMKSTKLTKRLDWGAFALIIVSTFIYLLLMITGYTRTISETSLNTIQILLYILYGIAILVYLTSFFIKRNN
jgi:hypothetical protein